jgi:hypothetical protein
VQPARRIAGAFETRDKFRRADLSQFVERELERLCNETVDAQAVVRRINVGLAVVLQRKELVAWRNRAVDLPDIEHPDQFTGVRAEVGRHICERDERLILRERRQDPFGQPDGRQGSGRGPADQHSTTSQPVNSHRWPPGFRGL